MPCRSSCCWRRTISRKRRRTRLRITAPPTRADVMDPARHRPESSSVIAFKIRSLPRCVIPFRFTCSYSERCVRRRAFGNENELTFVVWLARIFSETSGLNTQSDSVIYRSVQKKSSTEYPREDFSKKLSALLRGWRFRRCFLGASRRFGDGIWSFRCRGTRHLSRRRRRGRGSWACLRSNSFSFLLARREKRGSGQNADIFLHS